MLWAARQAHANRTAKPNVPLGYQPISGTRLDEIEMMAQHAEQVPQFSCNTGDVRVMARAIIHLVAEVKRLREESATLRLDGNAALSSGEMTTFIKERHEALAEVERLRQLLRKGNARLKKDRFEEVAPGWWRLKPQYT
jgi:hypothetical protein